MRYEKILPCVCVGREPNSDDSMFLGMPSLQIAQNDLTGEIRWYIYCPNCGRGSSGLIEAKTSRSAFRQWNEMQNHLRIAENPFLVAVD